MARTWTVGRGWIWIGAACVVAGCASMPRELPAEYFVPRRTLEIRVVNELGAPQILDRTEVSAGQAMERHARKRDMLADLRRETASGLLTDHLGRELSETFDIRDRDAELVLKVTVDRWGWTVSRDPDQAQLLDHRLYLMGIAVIEDVRRPDEAVYRGLIRSEAPLGYAPTPMAAQEAFPSAVVRFGQALTQDILVGRPR